MLEDLIVWAVPLTIPVLLVASWLYNHKTPSGGGGNGGGNDGGQQRSAPSSKPKQSQDGGQQGRLSDDQMTSS